MSQQVQSLPANGKKPHAVGIVVDGGRTGGCDADDERLAAIVLSHAIAARVRPTVRLIWSDGRATTINVKLTAELVVKARRLEAMLSSMIESLALPTIAGPE